MSDWKDEYRERKDASGKTWDEFVATELVHENEVDDLRAEVDTLNDHVESLAGHIQELRRTIGDAVILADAPEGWDDE